MSDSSEASYGSFSSEEKEENIWDKYSDIVPIPLPQETGDPFFILYTEEYCRLFGILHALYEKKEISERALAICNMVIEKYSVHYTAWWYKFEILQQLGYDYNEEMNLIESILADKPKCYQAWYYKQWLVDHLEEDIDQTSFLKATFLQDAKNFHAWCFCIWYAERWHREEHIFELIKEQVNYDCRNNSAWNARRTIGKMIGVDLTSEFEAAAESLRRVGKNEAAVNFLLSIVEERPDLREQSKTLATELITKKPDNYHAMRILLALADTKEETEKICDMIMEVDKLRIPYYTLIKQGVIPYK